ncbi:MAG: CCA tRNA nucleotidyltransferase [Candidatus Parcubacteria bacterium]|nr:CCA tRNA nucleotidyltransferase [Candidatus Parcubacteria bacterium]
MNNKNFEQSISQFLKDFVKDPNFKFVEKLLKKFMDSEIYLVGGKVRDILLQRTSYDYDFVVRNVNAKDLEKFLAKEGAVNLVGKSFGVFKFVPKKYTGFEPIDIALPRTEHSFNTGGYRDFDIQSDPKLPIAKDLERRDFTINSMALNLKTKELIDPFKGQENILNKMIKTVGKPVERFQEDYTRMLRAIRFSIQLYFKIDQPTYITIQKMAPKIKDIPAERITEEFNKIVLSPNSEFGLQLLQKSNLFSVKALGFAAQRNYNLNVRLASLFHDIAKPQVKKGEGPDSTFYNHDIVGAKITRKILQRLKYPNETIDKVSHLVRHHMFFYSLGTITDAAIRRLLVRIGPDNINEAIQLRICDRLGMGRPKAKPFKLMELEKRLHEVQLDPISVKMLKVKGDELMKLLKIIPGPKIGLLLNALLAEVLEDPKRNRKAYLQKKLKELNKLSDSELKELAPQLEKYEEERKKQYFSKVKWVE